MKKTAQIYPEESINLQQHYSGCKEMSEVLLSRSRGIIQMVQLAALSNTDIHSETLRATMEQLDGNLKLLEMLLEDLHP